MSAAHQAEADLLAAHEACMREFREKAKPPPPFTDAWQAFCYTAPLCFPEEGEQLKHFDSSHRLPRLIAGICSLEQSARSLSQKADTGSWMHTHAVMLSGICQAHHLQQAVDNYLQHHPTVAAQLSAEGHACGAALPAR